MRWVLVAMLTLTACGADEAPRNAAPVVRDATTLRDFTGVTLGSGDQVEITQGPTFRVRIDGSQAAQDRLEIRRDGDMLKIGRKAGGLWNGTDDIVRIHITMPTLQSAILAGSGDMTIDRTGEGFAGSLGGSGDMTIGQLRGDAAALTVGGTGTIAAAGAVRRLTLSVAGTGTIDARQVKANEASVSIAGSGDVVADIDGPAQVSIVGSGSATLGRDARCVVNRVGSGTLDCG